MNTIKKLLHNILRIGSQQRCEPQPLSVKGYARAPLTPEPDDDELAAQALLEILAGAGRGDDAKTEEPEKGTAEYYEALAEKIRRAHVAERKAAMRATAYCEERLQQGRLTDSGEGSAEAITAVLYSHLDTVDREGGELKRRWQHCLAEATVIAMRKSGTEF